MRTSSTPDWAMMKCLVAALLLTVEVLAQGLNRSFLGCGGSYLVLASNLER